MDQKIYGYQYSVKPHTYPRDIHNPSMEKVGDRIRRLRKVRKLTQAQVAKAVGVTQGSFAQLETGTSKSPSSVTLTRLARFFEVDPEWLMTGKGAQQQIASFSDAETELILLFRALSSDGQSYILGRAKAIQADEHNHPTHLRRRSGDTSSSAPKPDKDGH